MGSFVSLLAGYGDGGDDDQEQGPTLLDMLNNGAQEGQEDTVNWPAMERRLYAYPEEAAAYAQSIDTSPLVRALLLPQQQPAPPVSVVRAFLEAHEDAVFHLDQADRISPLLAAVMRECMQASSPPQQEQAEEQQHDDYELFAIVKLLVDANPDACAQPDRQGRLPLHFVRSCPETARLLVEHYPQGPSQTDNQGRLALHYACGCSRLTSSATPATTTANPSAPRLSPSNPSVIQLLLEHSTVPCGGALLKDKSSEPCSPLDIVYREFQASLSSPPSTFSNEEQGKSNKDADQLWDILSMLVQAAIATNQDKDTPSCFRLVHALVTLHGPVAILEEALRRVPHQALERDENGHTPLLLAAADTTIDPAVICCLIRCHPQAARIKDAEERLPIDILAENPNVSDADVLEAMVRAEPRAVDTRDLKYHRHPFLTAALAGAHQGSIYHLLRAQPHVIKHFLQDTDEK